MDDFTMTEVVRRYHDRPTRVDRAAIAHVAREREEAGRRLARTRELLAWQREMAQLDAEEQAARASRGWATVVARGSRLSPLAPVALG